MMGKFLSGNQRQSDNLHEAEGDFVCKVCGGGCPAFYRGNGVCPDCWPDVYTSGATMLRDYLEDHPGWGTRVTAFRVKKSDVNHDIDILNELQVLGD